MINPPNIHKALLDKIEQQQDRDGVDFASLPAGTVVRITTQNSLYVLRKTGGEYAELSGGRWINPILVRFDGSTWGGSCIMPDWIGVGMNLEIYFVDDQKLRLTSVVQSFAVDRAERKEYED